MDDLTKQFKETLAQEFPEATQIAEVVKTFRFWRKGHDYLVQITDSGDPADNFRFMVLVYLDGKQVGRGNGGNTLKTAIQVFQWSNLDRP